MNLSQRTRLFFAATLLLIAGCTNHWYSDALNLTCLAMPSDTSNSVGLIASDMQLPHEGHPHGVPESYDWSRHPRLGYGSNPGKFTAFIAWGQVYEDDRGSPTTNTRVQIRDIRAYVLSRRDHQWHLLQSSRSVQGDAFREDFSENFNTAADVRDEEDGGVSVYLTEGYNFHFWDADGRVVIEPSDIGGIFTTVQARLISENPALTDDREQARYLMSMGADYWIDLSSGWQADWTANGDVGIGRFRYITPDWQSFNMTTLTPSQLCQNPPPL